MPEICPFKPIYDALNTTNSKTSSLFYVTYTIPPNPILLACTVDGNVQMLPNNIQILPDIISNIYDNKTTATYIAEVPIYFIVVRIYRNIQGDEYTHVSLFIYYNQWFSLGLSKCDTIVISKANFANLLTPDYIFNEIGDNLFVIDFGILNNRHIAGIQKYIGIINPYDSHLNQKKEYYTFNLRQYYSYGTTQETEFIDCSKFILTIFNESISCSTKEITPKSLSSINTNIVACNAITRYMTIAHFLYIRAGLSNNIQYFFCKMYNAIFTYRLGGLTIKNNNKNIKRKTNKKKKKKITHSYKCKNKCKNKNNAKTFHKFTTK